MNLDDLMEEFLKAQLERKSKGTEKIYRQRLSLFKDYCDQNKIILVNQLTEEHIKKYTTKLKRKKLSINSQYMYLNAIKKFMEYIYEESYIFLNLSQDIALPKWERLKKKRYTAQQVEGMMNTLKEPTVIHGRNKLIMLLSISEGLRTGDIYRLSVLDIDLEEKELRLTKQKRFHKLKETTVKHLKEYMKKR